MTTGSDGHDIGPSRDVVQQTAISPKLVSRVELTHRNGDTYQHLGATFQKHENRSPSSPLRTMVAPPGHISTTLRVSDHAQ